MAISTWQSHPFLIPANQSIGFDVTPGAGRAIASIGWQNIGNVAKMHASQNFTTANGAAGYIQVVNPSPAAVTVNLYLSLEAGGPGPIGTPTVVEKYHGPA